jgi:hypothetical protein
MDLPASPLANIVTSKSAGTASFSIRIFIC